MNEDGKLIRIFPALSGRDLTVEDMDLEVAVRNALKRSGIHTLDQLLQLSHPELVRIFPNRELSSYEDVIHCLVCLSEETEKMGTSSPDFICEGNIGNTLGKSKISEKKFNIFQVAGIWKSEEIHTSVIAELINPKSEFHDKGADFLEKFLQMQKIGVELTGEKLEDAVVETEVPTGQGRRIDMVITTKNLYLPFEVKIWAGDQDAQLRHYYEFAKSQGKEVPAIYYLTPEGHEPSEQSRGDLGDAVRLLSFKADIRPWLKECMDTLDIRIHSDVWEIMRQLYDNIAGQPGSQGFSKWTWDVLDTICLELARKYDLQWTDRKDRKEDPYKIFTLKKEGFLEFDLRIEKAGKDQVELYLICCLKREGEKISYRSDVVDKYISEHKWAYSGLLKATFKDGGKTFGVKDESVTIKTAWNRLPENLCRKKLDAEQCLCEIEKIFKELNPRVYQALKRK